MDLSMKGKLWGGTPRVKDVKWYNTSHGFNCCGQTEPEDLSMKVRSTDFNDDLRQPKSNIGEPKNDSRILNKDYIDRNLLDMRSHRPLSSKPTLGRIGFDRPHVLYNYCQEQIQPHDFSLKRQKLSYFTDLKEMETNFSYKINLQRQPTSVYKHPSYDCNMEKQDSYNKQKYSEMEKNNYYPVNLNVPPRCHPYFNAELSHLKCCLPVGRVENSPNRLRKLERVIRSPAEGKTGYKKGMTYEPAYLTRHDLCLKSTAKGDNFKRFNTVHRKIRKSVIKKLYRCYMCERSYKQARDYRAHVATHKNGSIYRCDICFTVMRRASDYLQHLKEHSQRDLIPCGSCGAYFRDKCTLAIHMRKHTGEKPFQCKICGKRFAQSGTCKRHQALHHQLI